MQPWLTARGMCAAALMSVSAMASLALMLTVSVATARSVGTDGRELTASAALETARFMLDRYSTAVDEPHGIVSISPNRKRYLVRLVRGDVQRNGIWITFLSGPLDSLQSASRAQVVTKLFTTGLGYGERDAGPHHDSLDYVSPISWLDEDRIAQLFSDSAGTRQVLELDLTTGQSHYLTHHSTHVLAFAIGRGDRIFYNAIAQSENATPTEDAFVLPESTDAYALFRGDTSGASMLDRLWSTEWFVKDPRSKARRVDVAGRRVFGDTRVSVSMSPDGTRAVVNSHPLQLPLEWDGYTNEALRAWLAEARANSYATAVRHIHQLFLVDLDSGESRPLWNAPTFISLGQVAWSPDGHRVLVAPTYLPGATDAAGLGGRSAAIVDVRHGTFKSLPIEVDWYRVSGTHWLANDQVELLTEAGDKWSRHVFEERASAWERDSARSTGLKPRTLRFELRQDLNTPPRLYVVDNNNGRAKLVMDPNPGLITDYRFGRVERKSGVTSQGATWQGLLFYPVGYVAGQRYPLVVQSSYGAASALGSAFTLYGDQAVALGPPQMAAYAGRVFAAKGIAVLHLNAQTASGRPGPDEAEAHKAAFETAITQLIAAGIVDRDKVGIIGFSRNGFYVEYALTHSSFPFAAAVTVDNWDPSYFQTLLTGLDSEAISAIGAAPYGKGLQAWIERAPGFAVEKIRTPLRKVAQTSGAFSVLGGWEIYRRMRALNKPVEYYVMADAERHGAHNPQNPAQILSVQQSTVDWFTFWLQDREDSDVRKLAQYARWHKLRELQITYRQRAGS